MIGLERQLERQLKRHLSCSSRHLDRRSGWWLE
nr:MAG TPA: hypothetical protein [Caudoviricetes sp.]